MKIDARRMMSWNEMCMGSMCMPFASIFKKCFLPTVRCDFL